MGRRGGYIFSPKRVHLSDKYMLSPKMCSDKRGLVGRAGGQGWWAGLGDANLLPLPLV